MESPQALELDPGSDTESELVSAIRARQAEQPEYTPAAPSFTDKLEQLREKILAHPSPSIEQMQADLLHAKQSKRNADLARLERQAGQRYAKCTLENFEQTSDKHRAVMVALFEYRRNLPKRNGEGLVLYGPVGTGKDHLAFAIARSACEQGYTVEWLYGQDWFGQIRDAMDGDTTEDAMLRRLTRPDLLVLSDPLPPVGNLTQHQSTMLYRAVAARYFDGKPTIATLNVASDEEADERIGAPTWDRLCDGAWKICCRWPSYRKPAREIK
jgi:DNA replication protein DnaC